MQRFISYRVRRQTE